MKKVLYSAVIISLIISLAAAVIAYGRGYRLNPQQKSLNSTGILSATSFPEGASIFIDGKLKSATNGSISLPPDWYAIRISKTGYQSWEKRVRIQGEVVTRIDGLLISDNPSLRTLTVSGVLTPSLSPSGTRVAYIIPEEEASASATTKTRTGIWLYELRNGPLGGLGDPKQIYIPVQKTDWYHSQILWSPDEKQLILETSGQNTKSVKVTSAVEIFLDNPGSAPLLVTSTLDSILSDWEDLKHQKQDQSLSSLPPALINFFLKSANNIELSPDNNKILYQATASASLIPIADPPLIGTNSTMEIRNIEPGKYYVYDIKEDKNFFILDGKTTKNTVKPVWYPDSKRILTVENISIGIIDYDGTNHRTVYSGPFAGNIVYPWTSAGKLVILTNLNKPNSLPNLYEVDIR